MCDSSPSYNALVKRPVCGQFSFFSIGAVSPLFGQASKARCYRSARGSKDLIKCDNRVYRYPDAATMFASINDR